jgi:hypothetical protein
MLSITMINRNIEGTEHLRICLKLEQIYKEIFQDAMAMINNIE